MKLNTIRVLKDFLLPIFGCNNTFDFTLRIPLVLIMTKYSVVRFLQKVTLVDNIILLLGYLMSALELRFFFPHQGEDCPSRIMFQ